MTHCSDDELVLHYYGESPDAGEHIAACAGCAERARDLASLLATVDEPVPARDERYGTEVWYSVRPHLEPGRGWWSATFRWGLAAAATVALVASSFVAGRLSMQPATRSVSPTRAAVDTADPQLARRVLLMSVADHLERSDRVLTDIMNAPEADLSVEQQWAGDLIAANRLYRQDALDANEGSVATVLDELERALLDVVHRPEDAAADLDHIRRRIDSAALLFKVRVLTNELRQRQLGPGASPTSDTAPIS
jgi:hypothetical protein